VTSSAEGSRPRRLLLLVPFVPRTDGHHGGSRATAQQIAALAARYRTAVLYLRNPQDRPMEDELRNRCDLVREVAHVPPQGIRRIARQGQVAWSLLQGTPVWVAWWAVAEYARCVRETAAEWKPDVIQLEFDIMGQYLSALGACPAPRVLVHHDPGSGSGPAPGARRLLAVLEQRAWKRYQRSIMRQVDRVVVFTERDRAAVSPLAGETPVVRIPLGGQLPEHPLSFTGSDRATVLFVGSFLHAPNADAARRLVDHIFPRVLAQRPHARLLLVGAHLPPDLRQRAGTAVEIPGRVPDVTPYLERANVVVAPLSRGGGMRVKVLDALAAGKAVVASSLAVEGLDLVNGREFCLADTDEEFSARVINLLDQENLRRHLGTNAREWAAEHLTLSRVADAYERLYNGLAQRA
jgi:glycosyltransferase involved in cell wall biosynthesis